MPTPATEVLGKWFCTRRSVRENACLIASAIVLMRQARRRSFLGWSIASGPCRFSLQGSLSRKEIEDEGSRVLRERNPRGVQV